MRSRGPRMESQRLPWKTLGDCVTVVGGRPLAFPPSSTYIYHWTGTQPGLDRVADGGSVLPDHNFPALRRTVLLANMRELLRLAALMLAVTDASAHYIFQQLAVGGAKNPVFKYIRQNSNYNSPVTDLASNDLRCNVGASGSATETLAVKAGDSFTFYLDTPVYHQGPVSL